MGSAATITPQASLCPLEQAAISPTTDLTIAVLQSSGLVVEVNAVSTILAGDPVAVFATLRDAFAWASAEGAAVMTITVSNARPLPERPASP